MTEPTHPHSGRAEPVEQARSARSGDPVSDVSDRASPSRRPGPPGRNSSSGAGSHSPGAGASTSPSEPVLDKAGWRSRLLRARRAVPASVRTAEAEALAIGALAAAAGTRDPVCCYVPVGTEPGSSRLLDALVAAGYELLVPIVPMDLLSAGSGPAPLDWARYRGAEALAEGPLGLRQPAGPGLGTEAITSAGLVLVPALAVDRRGVRLGRGGGWYDRTLPLAAPNAALVAVIRDEELVRALPAEPHDVLMTGVLTPSSGARALPLALD